MGRGLGKQLLVIAVFALAGISLMACAAKRTQLETVSIGEVRANLKYENIMFKNFSAEATIQYPEKAIFECRNTAIDYLRSKDVFKSVEAEDDRIFSGRTLYAEVKIVELRIVGASARIWGGVFAGQSHMKIQVTLTDSAGNLVAQQELEGAPNTTGAKWSFGGSDRSLPKNMGVLLGDYILTKVSGK